MSFEPESLNPEGEGTPTGANQGPTEREKEAFAARDAAKQDAKGLAAQLLGQTYKLTEEEVKELAEVPRDKQEDRAKALAFDRLQASGSAPTAPAPPPADPATPPATPPANPPAAEPPTPPPVVPDGADRVGDLSGQQPISPADPLDAAAKYQADLRAAKDQAEADAVTARYQGMIRRGEIEDPVHADLKKRGLR